MKVYHGSHTGGLTELKPILSEHGKPYIYFSSKPVVALLYAVKPVPKPFSYYPYGFDKNGIVVYSEYWENAFYEIYKEQSGFLYECNITTVQNPTVINCAYTCESPVKVDCCTEIEDVYDKFIEFKNDGLFKVIPYKLVSEKEIDFIHENMRQEIQKNDLKVLPKNPMSQFIQKYFPDVWNNTSL